MLYRVIFWSLFTAMSVFVVWTVLSICEVDLLDAIAYQTNTSYAATYKAYHIAYLEHLADKQKISIDTFKSLSLQEASLGFADIKRSCSSTLTGLDVTKILDGSRSSSEKLGYLDQYADRLDYLLFLYFKLVKIRFWHLAISLLAILPFLFCITVDYRATKEIRENYVYYVPKLQKSILVTTTWYVGAFTAYTIFSPFSTSNWLYYISLIALSYLLYRVFLLITDRKKYEFVH